MFRRRPPAAPEVVQVTVDGLPEPLALPADAVRALATAALPAILAHKSVALVLGTPPHKPACPHCGR
jgi:hypothetical protein